MDDISSKIDALGAKGLLRELKSLTKRGSDGSVDYKGKKILNLSSNDYLGISSNIELRKEFYSTLDEESELENFSLGLASSRLLTGDAPLSHNFEKDLALKYRTEEVLLFNSGYHANIGILPALCNKKDLILSDKLNHASIHDGIRLSNSKSKRFIHKDYDQLEHILKKYRGDFDNVYIVSESVFSMDGDVADIPKLLELKEKYSCFLYLDEAHAIGMYGNEGLGKAEEIGVLGKIDFLVATFGKAFGSIGAFVACSATTKKLLINQSRSFIFTTALPPVVTHWNNFVFQKIIKMSKERQYVQQLSAKLRQSLRDNKLVTFGETNIVPVIIGDNSKTVQVSELMIDHGFYMLPIRPPTVPVGSSRFRISITAAMKWDDIKRVAPKIVEAMVA